MMRLDRFLCETGFGTRSQVKDLVKKGLVTVNRTVAGKPEQKVDEARDTVICNGKKAVYAKFVYIMLHKPAGYVSATSDSREQTVLDLLCKELQKGIFPVGRLDKDTEGLLLLTDDGDLAHLLLSPKRHVDKTYYAQIEGCVTEEHVKRFWEGIEIGEKKETLPSKLQILKSAAVSEIKVTIQEGKYHQIKRMFEAVGCKVLYLKRLSMGTLELDQALKAGEYRALTEEEIKSLKQLTGQQI